MNYSKGDRVKCINSRMGRELNNGHHYTVTNVGIRTGYLYLDGVTGAYQPDRFVMIEDVGRQRKVLSTAIEIVQQYGVGVSVYDDLVWTEDREEKLPAQLIDELLPIETPHQAKMRELEQRQRAIEDELRQLRDADLAN